MGVSPLSMTALTSDRTVFPKSARAGSKTNYMAVKISLNQAFANAELTHQHEQFEITSRRFKQVRRLMKRLGSQENKIAQLN